MTDFKEVISYKRYLLVKGMGTFKYGGDLNHFLTEKTGQSHFKHRVYYDIHVVVNEEPINILGSEIIRLYSSKFAIQKIEKGIHVYFNDDEYFLEADHFYLENNAAPDHVQPEGDELYGDFVNTPVLFIVHEIKQKEVCKKGIATGNSEIREDENYLEFTTGEFISGTNICETEWRKLTTNEESPVAPPLVEKTNDNERVENIPPPISPGPESSLGCLPIILLILSLAWAAFMIYLAVNNSSFLPILFGIGIPILLFGLVEAISWLGHISKYFGSLLKWSLNLLLLIVIMSVFDGLFQLYKDRNNWNSRSNNGTSNTNAIEVNEVNPNDNTSSNKVDEQQEFQKPYKIIHLKWKDQKGSNYNGSFKLLIEDLNMSSYNISSLKDENYTSFADIYSNVYNLDKDYLTGLYDMFDSIKDKNQQNKNEFANTIVTMVQSIKYVLVLDNSCSDPYNRRNPIIRELLDLGVKCVGPAPFGLKTPSEFMASTEGDCDTRTLLLYTIFKHFKYDVAIINSEYYGHSMLGLNIPGARGMYKNYNGKKYYFWETTQLGPKLGELQREIGNINYWKITLN